MQPPPFSTSSGARADTACQRTRAASAKTSVPGRECSAAFIALRQRTISMISAHIPIRHTIRHAAPAMPICTPDRVILPRVVLVREETVVRQRKHEHFYADDKLHAHRSSTTLCATIARLTAPALGHHEHTRTHANQHTPRPHTRVRAHTHTSKSETHKQTNTNRNAQTQKRIYTLHAREHIQARTQKHARTQTKTHAQSHQKHTDAHFEGRQRSRPQSTSAWV